MVTWFTSDTHFSHKNIINLGAGRPFKDIQHHNEMLVKNWNNVVSPTDTVFHLGDVALGPWPDGLSYVKRLNGHKVLVPGNHDRISSVEKPARQERFLPDYDEAFQKIFDEVSWTVVGTKPHWPVMMSHYPYDGDSHGTDRYTDLRPVDNGVPLIHGHNHCGPSERESVSAKGTPQFAVGVDANNWTPVHEDTIIRWLKGLDTPVATL